MRRPSLEPVRHGVLVDHLGLGAKEKLDIAGVFQDCHLADVHRNLLIALSESPLPGIGRRDSVRGSESRDTIDGKIQIGVPRGSIVGLFRCFEPQKFQCGRLRDLGSFRAASSFFFSLLSFFLSFSSFSPLLFLSFPDFFFLLPSIHTQKQIFISLVGGGFAAHRTCRVNIASFF